jgi:hypothetical protein
MFFEEEGDAEIIDAAYGGHCVFVGSVFQRMWAEKGRQAGNLG